MIRLHIFLFFIFIPFIGLCVDSGEKKHKDENKTGVLTEKNILSPAKISSEYSTLCMKENVVGFWKVVKWTPYFYIKAKDWDKPLYLKYQWYLLFADGSFRTMSSKKEQDDKIVKDKLMATETELRYKFIDKGVVEFFHQKNKKFKEIWRCALVTENLPPGLSETKVEKGDLLMSLLDANNTVIYVRQMRKVK